jgi:hypothetical protein
VAGVPVLSPDSYAADRLCVYLKTSNSSEHEQKVSQLLSAGFPVIRIEMDDIYDIGRQYFIWELATAIAGWSLQINPFDQPNVESAKKVSKKLVQSYKEKGQLPQKAAEFKSNGISLFGNVEGDSLKEILTNFLNAANLKISGRSPRSYIAIQAYLKPDDNFDQLLAQVAVSLHKKYKLAVTVGYGPRFLHSTGQLHKGDSGNGLFIQLTGDNQHDLNIPDGPLENTSTVTFGILKTAQYLGDYEALKNAGRDVVRIDLGPDIVENLRKIVTTVSS